MKHLILLFLFSILSINSEAQALPNWFSDKEKALDFAKANETNILMIFSGSDWCKPCIKFKKDILDAAPFKGYSEKNLAILYLDFPAKKKNKLSKEQRLHNEALADVYNSSGRFPELILLDQEFQIIKRLNTAHGSAEEFIKNITQ